MTVALLAKPSLASQVARLFARGEQGAWYDPSDLSTLFQDAAGTTPVTAVEQPVGLMLDKSKGLALGPELVTNGTFDADTNWTTDSGWTISSGKAVATNASGGYSLYQAASVSPEKLYRVTFTISNYVSGGVFASLFDGDNSLIYSENGTYTEFILAKNTRGYLGLAAATGGFTGSIDNISVRELPGNHAYQTVSTKRPVLSARVNLLTKTEDFGDAGWVKGGSGASPPTFTTYTGTNPKGETGTIYRFTFQNVPTTIGWCILFRLTSTAQQASVVHRNSLYIKRVSGGNKLPLSVESSTLGPATNGYSSTVFTVTDSWQQYSYESALTNTPAGNLTMMIGPDGRIVSNVNLGEITVDIWGADLRVANSGVNLPAYQKVNTATDYDTAGFPTYLTFDGIDDSMQTNSIDFTATDKMTVVAGVRKLSDAAAGILFETSLDVTAGYPGSFSMFSPHTASGTTYQPYFRGDVGLVYESLTPFAAPITNVVAVQMFNRLPAAGVGVDARVNGVAQIGAEVNSITDAGNFGNYPLYIGARAGTSLFFNGRFYGLIVRGAESSESQIRAVERYLNSKTRAY